MRLLMIKILIINGPNLNMLGLREINQYGKISYDDLCNLIKTHSKNKVQIECYQSNIEGEIVSRVQEIIEQDIDALSIAAHPGGTASQLQINTRKMGGVGISGPFWVYVMKFFGMTIHQGALSQLMGVLSNEVKNGDYIGPKGSGSAFKGNAKVIENYSVSESNLEDFRSLIKKELSLNHI